jgi:FkbM family methyltransferase
MNLNLISKYFIPHRVLDIGANIGEFHKEFKTIYPNSYVFSIEASRECESELKKITNDYLIALLAKDTSIYQFYSRKGNPTCTGNSIYRELTHFYSDDQIDILEIESMTLDDIFTEDSEFDVIKIDTQGSELDIISGGNKLCSKANGMILEVSLTPYNQDAPLYDEVLSFMDNFGFIAKEILDESFNNGSHQLDILFIKKEIKK